MYVVAASLLIGLCVLTALCWSTTKHSTSFRQLCLLTVLNFFVFHPFSRINNSEATKRRAQKTKSLGMTWVLELRKSYCLKDFALSLITNFVKLCLFTNLMVLGTFSQEVHKADQQILPSELRNIYFILILIAAIQTYLQFLYFKTDWKSPTVSYYFSPSNYF